jgi:predicted PurR-regulated permease PerM
MTAFPKPGVVTLLAVIALDCALLFLLQKIIWLAAPLFLALMFYYWARPLVGALVLRGVRHGAAATAVWIVLQAAAVVALIAGASVFAARGNSWPQHVGRYLAGGKALIRQASGSLETSFPALRRIGLGSQAEHAVDELTDRFAQRHLLRLAVIALESLPSVLLVPYITYFLLTDSARLKKYVVRSVPNAFFEKALLLVSGVDASLQNYFRGLLVLTSLDTLTLWLGLVLLGIPHAFVLALVAAVLSWIPYLGSAMGLVLIMLVAATDLPNREWATYACMPLCLGVHLLDDFVYTPLVIGRILNVHPLLSVALQFLGALAAGAWGLILVLPLFAVSAIAGETLAEIVADRRLRARHRAALRLAELPRNG